MNFFEFITDWWLYGDIWNEDSENQEEKKLKWIKLIGIYFLNWFKLTYSYGKVYFNKNK